jgi:protein TonB
MTNKEIMQASLLDIVFDNRNKAYGAYALRRYYPNRLLIALGSALSIVLLFWLFSPFVFKKVETTHNPIGDDKMVTVSIIPPDFIEPPPPPVQQLVQTAQSDHQEILIVPDPEVTESLPTTDDLDNSNISNINVSGLPPTDIVTINNPVSNTGNVQQEIIRTEPEILISPTDPEYPGGRDALVRFLQLNLIVPDELEIGNQKTVQVKFKINEEGKMSDIEIRKSAGESFDKEVIRVCKKMKRWKPATQNGRNVTTTFLLPVTFVATEQ